MNYLLDTHTCLWSLFSTNLLSRKANEVIVDPIHSIYVSTISFWEISLKYSLGKIELTHIVPDELPQFVRHTGLEILDLSENTASSFYKLPRELHKDPFDRLLVWEAIQRDLILISKDPSLKAYEKYGLKLVW